MQTKYIPTVIGDTRIGACQWISNEWKYTDIAFDTWDEAVRWLKD